MSINRLFWYTALVLFFTGLPFGTFAANAKLATAIQTVDSRQDKKGSKQERGKSHKEQKKPEVKEVPQSRKQQKPSEVKQDKKGKNTKDNKRRN